jgi:hypothetical protein
VLPKDATVETVWPTLTHQRDYVGGILHKMRQCLREHGNAYVSIGITGSGQKPYYRITFQVPSYEVPQIFGSYYDNHDPLEIAFADTSNWSLASLSYDSLLDLFARKTGYRGAAPRV